VVFRLVGPPCARGLNDPPALDGCRKSCLDELAVGGEIGTSVISDAARVMDDGDCEVPASCVGAPEVVKMFFCEVSTTEVLARFGRSGLGGGGVVVGSGVDDRGGADEVEVPKSCTRRVFERDTSLGSCVKCEVNWT
jgi:hypothetical protein